LRTIHKRNNFKELQKGEGIFVDRIRLLVNQLNAIARGSIGDEAHISMILTQIGPEIFGLKRH
jgi:hypothetical protein